MSLNIWINQTTGEYKTLHNGIIYTRTSQAAAIELMNDLLLIDTIKFKNDRLDRTLYAQQSGRAQRSA